MGYDLDCTCLDVLSIWPSLTTIRQTAPHKERTHPYTGVCQTESTHHYKHTHGDPTRVFLPSFFNLK